MGTLFDVMGSVVAGSLVMITIFTSIINFQEMNYNILVMSNMIDIGEEVYHVFDQYYFANVQSVDIAQPSLFVYKGRVEGNVTDSIRVQVDSEKEGIGYPLNVRIYDIATGAEKPGAGTYLVDNKEIFTYLDESVDTTTVISNIRNVQLDLIFVHEGWKNSPPIKYFVRVFKSFKTVYLNSIAGGAS